jgi:hypothetical protein
MRRLEFLLLDSVAAAWIMPVICSVTLSGHGARAPANLWYYDYLRITGMMCQCSLLRLSATGRAQSRSRWPVPLRTRTGQPHSGWQAPSHRDFLRLAQPEAALAAAAVQCRGHSAAGPPGTASLRGSASASATASLSHGEPRAGGPRASGSHWHWHCQWHWQPPAAAAHSLAGCGFKLPVTVTVARGAAAARVTTESWH